MLHPSEKAEPSIFHFALSSSEEKVGNEHDGKADEERICCSSLASVGMGLGYHFVADDIQHRAARKGECKRSTAAETDTAKQPIRVPTTSTRPVSIAVIKAFLGLTPDASIGDIITIPSGMF